jgi:hypothetical protein
VKLIVFTKMYVLDDIKIRRLGLAGGAGCHIIRMEEESIPQGVLDGKFHNKRSVAKLRTRWEDVVQRDALHILGI